MGEILQISQKYYKFTFDDIEQIVDDEDYNKVLENDNYFYTIIENEKEHLLNQGVPLINNGSNFIITTNDKAHFKYINTFNVSQCDKKGKLLKDYNVTDYNKRSKMIVDYLKSVDVRYYDIVHDKNYIKFACPICQKEEMKCSIGIKSLNVKTFSNTDCDNELHWEQWKKWKEDIRELENPDFTKVQWNEDFVYVTYKNNEGDKVNTTLRKYNEIPFEEQPKIIKFQILDVIENVRCLLEHYKITCKFNSIKLRPELNGIPLYEILIIIQDMGIKHNLRLQKEKLTDYLIKICKENKYNPLEDYLKQSYEYYKNNPDNEIFKKLIGTIYTTTKNKEEYIYKFLLQMVYIACNDENKTYAQQYLLVLQGKYGTQKTTWLQNLIPKELRFNYWLGGRNLDLNKKDDILEMMSCWLCECGEIATTFRKSDQEAMKNYITSIKDKVRPPYGKEAIEKIRTMCLCATTNDVEYLRDTTGNRRYLTLTNCHCNAYHNIDLNMLWGYMYSKYLSNDEYWFNQEKLDEITMENRNYLIKSDNILELESVFDLFPKNNMGEWYSTGQICEEIPLINKFKLGKELKANNVKFKVSHNQNLYYLKRI